MPLPPDDDIRLALAHVSNAIAHYEQTAADAYAEAAFNARLTNYGHLCAKRAILQRIGNDLKLLARSLSHSEVLVADE